MAAEVAEFVAMLPAARGASEIRRRAAAAIAALVGRTIVTRAVAGIALLVMARVVAPDEFGLVGVVVFTANFLAILGDAGVGAALIQQRDEPGDADLRTAFTAQVTASLILCAIGWALAPVLSRAYHLGDSGALGVRIALLAMPVTAVRGVSCALMQRAIDFRRVAAVDIVATFTFFGATTLLLSLGAGRPALVLGVLLEAIGGTATALALGSWLPRPGLDIRRMRRLLRFGLVYQVQLTLSYVKDAMTATVVAIALGSAAAGYVNWAFAIATLPLMVTTPLAQVMFPALARLRNDPAAAARFVEDAVRVAAIVIMPTASILIVSASALATYGFGARWDPAVSSLVLFSVSMCVGPVLGAASFSLFFAFDRGRLALAFTVLYGILDWGLGIPLLVIYGFDGIAVRTVAVSVATTPLIVAATRRLVKVRLLRQAAPAAGAAAVAGAVDRVVLGVLPGSLGSLGLATAVALAVYASALAVLDRRSVSRLMDALRRRAPIPREARPCTEVSVG